MSNLATMDAVTRQNLGDFGCDLDAAERLWDEGHDTARNVLADAGYPG